MPQQTSDFGNIMHNRWPDTKTVKQLAFKESKVHQNCHGMTSHTIAKRRKKGIKKIWASDNKSSNQTKLLNVINMKMQMVIRNP